jgi:dihydrofolate synthase/folylpolyglutamate synthase
VIDGAHNGDSAGRLAEALRAEFQFEGLVLVLGVLQDKDANAIAVGLVPHAREVVLTRPQHPRALLDLDRLAATVQPHLCGTLHFAPDVATALDLARKLAGPHDLICAAGSLAVAADARVALGLAERDSAEF